jgi:hypothetical protein
MQGSLTDINVSDLVLQLYSTKKSGILRLSQGDVKKSIYFKEGSVVFAHSNLKHERLGEILLRLGKLSEEEFAQIATEMEEGRRLGQILYEKGFLSPYEITSGVSYQLQQILYSVFNWDSGEYEFLERERPVYEDIMVDVSTPALLIDGIRNISNLNVLQRAIGNHLDAIVQINVGEKRFPRTNLDFSEETILACVDGKSTVEQLHVISRLSIQEFGRAMYLLLISELVRLEEGDLSVSRVREEVKKRWTQFITEPMPSHVVPPEGLEETQNRIKTLTETEMRKKIRDTVAALRDASDEEVLQIPPGSTTDEIQRGYDKVSAVFHPLYYSPDRYRDLKDELKEIIDRQTEARQNLLDKLKGQVPLTEVRTREMPSSTPEATGRQPSAPAHASAQPQQAGPEPSPPPSPPAVAEPPATGGPPQEIDQQVTPEPEAPHPVQPRDDRRLVGELQTVLHREPGNVTLLRELGLRLQQSGKAREGEKHLLQALQLEPQNIETHFALADFYQVQGMKFKAFKHLNVILQIDPQNKRAMDMLGVKKRKKGLYDIGRK